VDAERTELLKQAVVRIADRCPRLVAQCYWAGSSAIAIEELEHRESFDLDFHTQEALIDTRPLLAELERSFPDALQVVHPPDAFGSGFTGSLALTDAAKVTLQVFAGFETVPDTDLVPAKTAPRLRRITLRRYLADKVQCVLERIEARDLIDIAAVMKLRPELGGVLRRAVAAQDAILLAERLLGWTEEAIRNDLRAYTDVAPADAVAMRDRLLTLVKETAR
jgi:hypothetical protein